MRPKRSLLHAVLSLTLLAACAPAPPTGPPIPVADSAERWDEVRRLAEELLPGSRPYEVLGMDSSGDYGDGRCSNWIYSFHSPQSGELLRVYLGRRGLVEAPFAPESLLPGQGPPSWPAEPLLDSAGAARAVFGGGLPELGPGEAVRLESYRLFVAHREAGPRLLWEVTLHLSDADLESGSAPRLYRREVDALSGEVLDPPDESGGQGAI